jgi:hypothetical protein
MPPPTTITAPTTAPSASGALDPESRCEQGVGRFCSASKIAKCSLDQRGGRAASSKPRSTASDFTHVLDTPSTAVSQSCKGAAIGFEGLRIAQEAREGLTARGSQDAPISTVAKCPADAYLPQATDRAIERRLRIEDLRGKVIYADLLWVGCWQFSAEFGI